MHVDSGICQHIYAGDWDGGIWGGVEGGLRALYMERSPARIASMQGPCELGCGAPVMGRR